MTIYVGLVKFLVLPKVMWKLNLLLCENVMKRGFFVLFFVLLCKPAMAEDLDIHIANRGNIPIYVAVVKYGGIVGNSTSDGWYEVKPSSWAEPRIVSGSTYATYYLAFAVKGAGGKLGIIDIRPGKKYGVITDADVSFAVHKTRPFEYSGNYKELQKAKSGQRLIPFRWKIDTGNHSRPHTVEVRVNPTKDQPVEFYLDGTGPNGEEAPETGIIVNNTLMCPRFPRHLAASIHAAARTRWATA